MKTGPITVDQVLEDVGNVEDEPAVYKAVQRTNNGVRTPLAWLRER